MLHRMSRKILITSQYKVVVCCGSTHVQRLRMQMLDSTKGPRLGLRHRHAQVMKIGSMYEFRSIRDSIDA